MKRVVITIELFFLILLSFVSCNTTKNIPSGLWVCEEDNIVLCVAGNNYLGLYQGQIATINIGYANDLHFAYLPHSSSGFDGSTFLSGDYTLDDADAFTLDCFDEESTSYHFQRQAQTLPEVNGKWYCETLSLSFTMPTSIGEDAQGNIIQICCTPDAPYIWGTYADKSYAQDSLLFFGVYEKKGDTLVIHSFSETQENLIFTPIFEKDG